MQVHCQFVEAAVICVIYNCYEDDRVNSRDKIQALACMIFCLTN